MGHVWLIMESLTWYEKQRCMGTLTSVVFPGIDPPDTEKEKTGIMALHLKERDVPHSVSMLPECSCVCS